jgi:hypothetical protein
VCYRRRSSRTMSFGSRDLHEGSLPAPLTNDFWTLAHHVLLFLFTHASKRQQKRLYYVRDRPFYTHVDIYPFTDNPTETNTPNDMYFFIITNDDTATTRSRHHHELATRILVAASKKGDILCLQSPGYCQQEQQGMLSRSAQPPHAATTNRRNDNRLMDRILIMYHLFFFTAIHPLF